ncbi:hypothetical protein [Caulobacter phage Cr30]|uniref:hypothetical protein n=1 Tax=Caulobacter phage Cr30 TaxID=1357714 RepID=UPI0004A9B518|nr:hypothetical protein OZ74_gp068 [Caulobacter phage Cr30]AGS80953.1 hypothetical protein [Caulobacter phage Cr30]
MLTEIQYQNLPHSFKRIVDIDRELPSILVDKVLPLFGVGQIVRERKYQRRMCEVACLPPSTPRSAGMA